MRRRGEVHRNNAIRIKTQPLDGSDPRTAETGDIEANGEQEGIRGGGEENTPEEVLTGDPWKLRFRLGTSRRYCSRLASHYSGLDSLTTVISLIGGSAAFAVAFAGTGSLALWASLAVVVATAARLGFRWSDKARLFTDLYQRYTRLQETLVRAGEAPSHAALRDIEADYILIEASEPKVRNALIIVCHNEEVTAQKVDPKHKHRLRFWQRWFATIITLPPFTWEH